MRPSDFEHALTVTCPSTQRASAADVEKKEWGEIGGYEELKQVRVCVCVYSASNSTEHCTLCSVLMCPFTGRVCRRRRRGGGDWKLLGVQATVLRIELSWTLHAAPFGHRVHS